MLDIFRKVWQLFPLPKKRKLVFLAILMTFSACLEMIAIGSLLPIVALIQKPSLIQTNLTLSRVSLFLGIHSTHYFLTSLLLLLLIIYVIKNTIVFILSNKQNQFISAEFASLATQLFSSYLNRPYHFHLQINTAQLIRNVTDETVTVLYFVLLPMITLISEGLVILALFSLIIMMNPIASLFSVCFGAMVIYGFFYFIRDKMLHIGKKIQIDSGKMIQYVQEGLGGIKEIKVLSREPYFHNEFSKHVIQYAKGMKQSLVINTLPRLVLETLFIALFVGMFFLFSLLGKSESVIPVMAVFGAAAFRLIPNLNRIMGAITQLKQGSASIDLVVKDLADVKTNIEPRMGTVLPFRFHIDIQGVTYNYPNSKMNALDTISFQIKHGEMIGFMGKSGSGKTTLIDVILGLLTPTRGRVLVDGKDIQENLSQWQNQIGYIPQNIYLIDESLRHNIALGLHPHEIDDERMWLSLEAARLADFVRTLPDGLNAMIGERGVCLSGGQRQRIGIARALYYDPQILILDEATSALDFETEQDIINTIRALRHFKTILVIAHRSSTIEKCDRVCHIEGGKLLLIDSFDKVLKAREDYV